MNFCQSDIPGASLNRRLPDYDTYWPHFDATCEALCIACIEVQEECCRGKGDGLNTLIQKKI